MAIEQIELVSELDEGEGRVRLHVEDHGEVWIEVTEPFGDEILDLLDEETRKGLESYDLLHRVTAVVKIKDLFSSVDLLANAHAADNPIDQPERDLAAEPLPGAMGDDFPGIHGT